MKTWSVIFVTSEGSWIKVPLPEEWEITGASIEEIQIRPSGLVVFGSPGGELVKNVLVLYNPVLESISDN